MSALSRFGVSREPRLVSNDGRDGTLTKVRAIVASRNLSNAPEVSIAPADVAEASTIETVQSHDLAVAIGFLEKATSGVDDLFAKFRQSENERQQALNKIQQYEMQEKKWKQDLVALEARLDEKEATVSSLANRVDELTNRLFDCEAHLTETEGVLKDEQERNAKLENNCLLLTKGIMANFGAGSPAYKLLNSDF